MNKSELIAAIANKTGVTKKDTEEVISAFVEVVKETLKAGEKVQMIGFGTFETVERDAREGVNPRTGEKVMYGPTVLPRFKPSKSLKDQVKAGDPE